MRKFDYKVYHNSKQVGKVNASNWKSAQAEAESTFGKNSRVEWVEDPAAVKYLTKKSLSRAAAGEDAYSIAWPFTSVMFYKDPRDTHTMNIADMLPGPVKIAFLEELGWDEAIENMDFYEKIDVYPKRLLKNIPESQRTSEIYAKIWTSVFAGLNKSKHTNDYDIVRAVYDMIQEVPDNKFSPTLIKITQNIILKTDVFDGYGENFGMEYVVGQLPDQFRTSEFMKALVTKDSDFVFSLGESLTPDLFIQAIKQHIKGGNEFTSMPFDWGVEGLEDYISDNVWNNPRVQNALTVLDEHEKHKKAEWAKGQSERDAAALVAKQERTANNIASVQQNGENIQNIARSERTSELMDLAVKNNPRAIFYLDPGERTKERWLTVLKAKPEFLDLIRPLELRDTIKQELSANSDISRIQNLAGITH